MMNRKVKYYLNKHGEFVIENYNLAKPFSSFFPGIAGLWGVPIWVFYVNRAQAIAGFGIKDKDHPIMEFNPANKAYQLTSSLGFRTFLKTHLGGKSVFYDGFASGINATGFDIENKMFISSDGLKLKETNHTLGLELDIEYFTIPNDNYGALARELTIKNISQHRLDVECLDGLPQIIPYGLNNMFLKEMSRTIEAWMDVENLEEKVPFFRLKVDPSDKPEVTHISEGNFYLAFSNDSLIRPIVDPQIIFGRVTDLSFPELFVEKRDFCVPQTQFAKTKTPCSFAYKKVSLKPDESLNVYSLSGNMDGLKKLKANSKRIANEEYLNKKRIENKTLINDLQSAVFTHSASKAFNFYCRQNFLDNVLRGGYPLSLGKPQVPHIQVYSRKHGDLERDYNRFLIEPTYFSQGNGNFRDANQNRRGDVWFNPLIEDESVFTFFNLIQADGYNPLVVKPDTFMFEGNTDSLNKFFKESEISKIKARLQRPFTPGELILFIEHNLFGEEIWDKREEFLSFVLSQSLRILNAEHGEGFWIDHWTYCLDLLEAYLGLYPENLENILLEKKEFTFFDNSETVKPRREKYVLKGKRVFQYHSVSNNHTKSALIRNRECFAHFSRTKNGEGDIYKVSLLAKMLVVIANKFASLDPFGIGLEMDADKPSWYDALNGLPALLGSSTSETFELKRWVVFLLDSFKGLDRDDDCKIDIPIELHQFLSNLSALSFDMKLNDYDFWDKIHTLRERYLENTLLGFKGDEKALTIKDLKLIFVNFLKKIDKGLKKAYSVKDKLYYSYFMNEVVDYKVLDSGDHFHLIKPLKFKRVPLPLFLEAVVHSLRILDKHSQAKKIFEAVRKSELYDRELKMYKVNGSLSNMPLEIGRCRIFTPGWLENESVWLHMEYKYILELLKNGLYKEFFEDFKNVLIPFQKPEQYGRSILENSSFLVSSVFPDKKLHGNGFVARLSGSTAEFISIWLIMCLGQKPFYLDKDKKLCLEFKPILPAWLFSDKEEGSFPKNTFAFKFLNKTLVVYHNPKRKDTFGVSCAAVKEIVIEYLDKKRFVFKSSLLRSPYTNDVRDGKISRIDIFLA